MSQTDECITFREFFRIAYDAATSESSAKLFKEYSKNGDREGMIKLILNIPYVRDLKITESYLGKNDVKAAELYEKAREVIVEDRDEHVKESKAYSILTEALFAASAGSRLFLDALLDCAKHTYNVKAFAKCLRYCECMLALPSCFYNKSAESASHFSERRKECLRLEHECSKKLGATTSRKKKSFGKRGAFFTSTSTSQNALKGKCVITMPTVDGKRHNILENCSDAVTLRSDEKRGRHLVASRNIKAGSVLIIDQPFSFSTEEEALTRNCLHCHGSLKLDDSVKIPCRQCQRVSFCSEKCRSDAWQAYHRYECPILNFFYEIDSKQHSRQTSHLLLAYRTTIAGALSQNHTRDNVTDATNDVPFLSNDFLQYHTANANDAIDENKNTGDDVCTTFRNLGISEVYNSQDYRTVLLLQTHGADMEPAMNLIRTIESIFLAKCFIFVLSKLDVVCSKETFMPLAVAMLQHLQAVNCNAYEIVENVRDEKSRVWEPRYVGGAIYPTVSLVNHSCYPNVVRHSYPSGIVVVRALRFIGKGNEILDCYGPHFLSEERLSRREYLWKKYRFLCGCEACIENWQYPLPETMSYKCRACSGLIDTSTPSKKDSQKPSSTKQCPNCFEKIDCKKLDNQLKKSTGKRLNAITKMYEGRYEDALPLLLEHMHFIEKSLITPNIETIKTQQCIVQCYNYYGCTSQ